MNTHINVNEMNINWSYPIPELFKTDEPYWELENSMDGDDNQGEDLSNPHRYWHQKRSKIEKSNELMQ